ncbi:MAG: hypothetical protein K2N18_06040, partial [Clostridia bacterium]|nr:hypothetical protein [Clostridia bacterium]
YILVTTEDYSISLTVALGRISKIVITGSYKTSTSAKVNTITMECTLSDFGTTDMVIPDEVLALRGDNGQASAVTAYAEDKKY